MKHLETIGRAILFAAGLIYLICAVLLIRYTFLARDLLEDAEIYPVGLSLILYSISLVIACVGAVLHSRMAYTEKTTNRIASLIVFTIILGTTIFFNSRSSLQSSAYQLERKLGELRPQYDWGLTGFSVNSSKEATDIWDTLQSNNECCGINSPKDWADQAPKEDPDILPNSCCANLERVESDVEPSGTKFDANQKCNSKTMEVYQQGCGALMQNEISSITAVFIVVLCVKVLHLVDFIVISVVSQETQKGRFNAQGIRY